MRMYKNSFKIIFLICCIFAITGCDATININLDHNNFDSMASIEMANKDIDNNIYDTIYNKIMDVDYTAEAFGYYKNISEVSNDLFSTLTLKFNRKLNEISYEPALINCYDNASIINKNNILNISTSDKIICYEKYGMLENVTLVISTKYKVLNNNADEISDDKYIWHIDKSNYENKPIIFEVNYRESNILTMAISIIAGCGIIMFMIILILVKNKKNNQI